jgi:protein O-mannosyl-transferase
MPRVCGAFFFFMLNRFLRHPSAVSTSLLVIIALTFACYWPGLHGDFLFDDSANLLESNKLKFQELNWEVVKTLVFSGDAGPLKRPISMLSFALNVAWTGFNPFYFKLTNLLIHLANGVLVFWLAMLLFRAPSLSLRFSGMQSAAVDASHQWMALALAGLWLLHPMNLTSVLYIVQRMNSLAAFFTFAAAICYVIGRLRMSDGVPGGRRWLVFGVGSTTALGLLSKENAVLVPVFLAVIEACFFRFRIVNIVDGRFLRVYFALILIVPAALLLLAVLVNPQLVLAGYEYRSFDLTERVLTQARVVWFYASQVFAPSNQSLGLYHDYIPISRSLTEPISTLAAVLAWLALIACVPWLLKRAPVVAFAILWFIGGHLLESTVVSLEIAHEHRNYVPLFGPLFMLVWLASWPIRKLHVGLGAAVLACIVALFAVQTHARAFSWRSLISQAETEVIHHPTSARANLQMGRVYSTLMTMEPRPGYFEKAIAHFEQTAKTDPWPGLVGLVRTYSLAKQPIPADVVTRLELAVARGSQPPAVPTLMQNIATCNMFEYCTLSDEQVLRILDGFIANPELVSIQRAIVMMVRAQYLVDKVGDAEAGIAGLERLVQYAPWYSNGPRNLARMYRLVGEFDRAKEQIELARRADKHAQMRDEINREEASIIEAEEKHRLSAETPLPRATNSPSRSSNQQ